MQFFLKRSVVSLSSCNFWSKLALPAPGYGLWPPGVFGARSFLLDSLLPLISVVFLRLVFAKAGSGLSVSAGLLVIFIAWRLFFCFFRLCQCGAWLASASCIQAFFGFFLSASLSFNFLVSVFLAPEHAHAAGALRLSLVQFERVVCSIQVVFSCVLSEDVASGLSVLSLLLRGFLGAGLRSALWVGDVCRHSCKRYAMATCGGRCVVFADVAGLSVWVLASFW